MSKWQIIDEVILVGGSVIAQVAGCWFLTKNTQIEFWVTSGEIFDGQSGTGAGFYLNSLVLLCSLSFRYYCALICQHHMRRVIAVTK